MYQIGDLVVYGSIGVCRITGISCPNADSQKQFYSLAPLYQSGTIFTPVEPGKVALRSAMTTAEATALLDQIPSIHAEIYKERTLQQLAHKYQSILQSGDALQLLTLILSVARKRRESEAQGRRLGMLDERFCKQAERLLYGELSVSLDIPDLPAYVAARIPEAS